MNRSRLVLFGIIMLVAMLGLLFFAGAIYDAEQKRTTESFFFQLPAKAENRVDALVNADDMSDSLLREIIIARFVHEYFYVIPDLYDAEMRQKFKTRNGKMTALRGLASRSRSVYNDWAQNVAPEIADLASQGALRMVSISPDFTVSDSGHLIVKYELATWTEPNNMLALPNITHGELYLDVSQDSVHTASAHEMQKRLIQDSLDPVSAFDFYIMDVIQN